jgi:FkbM family methyltransferase
MAPLAALSNDARYALAEQHLTEHRYDAALEVLAVTLDAAPRAAQSLYLFGAALLLQERWTEARPVLDRAYRLKPWIRDLARSAADLRPSARAALRVEPDWPWARYELARDAYTSVGLTLDNVVAEHLAHPEVFFVEIGANDGKRGDPLFPHIDTYGWSGLAVEPMPETFAALQTTFRDRPSVRTVQVALTTEDGPVTLYRRDGDRSSLASLLPERNALSRQARPLTPTQVEGNTFGTLFARHHVQRVDVLQIDTEGYDYEVLRCFDLERYRPLLVNLEFYCLPIEERLEVFELFRRAGYAYRYNGRDLVAVDRARCTETFCLRERPEPPVQAAVRPGPRSARP